METTKSNITSINTTITNFATIEDIKNAYSSNITSGGWSMYKLKNLKVGYFSIFAEIQSVPAWNADGSYSIGSFKNYNTKEFQTVVYIQDKSQMLNIYGAGDKKLYIRNKNGAASGKTWVFGGGMVLFA